MPCAAARLHARVRAPGTSFLAEVGASGGERAVPCCCVMRTPRSREPLDVFEAFEASVEDGELVAAEAARPRSGRSVAVTGGVTLAAIVLAALAFVIGLRWGMGHVPGPALANPLLGVLANVVFALVCGLLLAMVAVSAGALAVGLPLMRRHVRR